MSNSIIISKPKTPRIGSYFLTGWIRGFGQENQDGTDALANLAFLERIINSLIFKKIDVFPYLSSAACLAKRLRGEEIMPTAWDIAYHIANYSGKQRSYNTCSFYVATHEEDILKCIYDSKVILLNKNEFKECFFINGRPYNI